MGIEHDLPSQEDNGCCRGHAGERNDFVQGPERQQGGKSRKWDD